MPEQNLEESSYRCQQNGAAFYFVNNHMRLNDIFLFFSLNVVFFTFKVHDPMHELKPMSFFCQSRAFKLLKGEK